MTTDRLVEIFMDSLAQLHDLEENASALIRRVAEAYMLELVQKAEVPSAFVNDVLDDLEHEVLEMYRKKTYGFLSLKEYREVRVLRRPAA